MKVFSAAVQIDHRRDETRVTEQLADRQQVDSRFQQSRRVAVSKNMGINPIVSGTVVAGSLVSTQLFRFSLR